MMKLIFILILSFCLGLFGPSANAQCSICTRTAQQLGEKPAKGLNAGIIYLALTPIAIMGILGYSWWKKNHSNE